jgi:uncharacterized protein YceH (UPF0502 family)
VLTPAEARVIGALMEKQVTTPDAYPLTLNALTAACNQTSSREPVVSYRPIEVETTVLALKATGFARVVYPGSGERATKYRQVADEVWRLDGAERAVLCVLLLRGPQTAAEVRARTERLHRFATVADVEAVLEAMAARPDPLVARARRSRWAQCVAEESGPDEGARDDHAPAVVPTRTDRLADLEARVDALERAVAVLRGSGSAGSAESAP